MILDNEILQAYEVSIRSYLSGSQNIFPHMKNLNLKGIGFFGSRVKGHFRPGSDLDILAIIDTPAENQLFNEKCRARIMLDSQTIPVELFAMSEQSLLRDIESPFGIIWVRILNDLQFLEIYQPCFAPLIDASVAQKNTISANELADIKGLKPEDIRDELRVEMGEHREFCLHMAKEGWHGVVLTRLADAALELYRSTLNLLIVLGSRSDKTFPTSAECSRLLEEVLKLMKFKEWRVLSTFKYNFLPWFQPLAEFLGKADCSDFDARTGHNSAFAAWTEMAFQNFENCFREATTQELFPAGG